MKIKSLQLKNFKRFTDLTLQDIPGNAKLVLLIGSNGSGKSSVFDAFEYLANQNGKALKNPDLDFKKDKAKSLELIIETFDYGKEGGTDLGWRRSNKLDSKSFYGRTSFRQIPRLTKKSLGSNFDVSTDDDRAASFIDRDLRFENDLEHLFGKLLKEFFRTTDDKSEIKQKVINPINESLERIFGFQNGTKLSLLEIIPPLEGRIAEINFQKGKSVFHYNFLSAGEKEVFNILINFVARAEYYKNTIFFFDEIDLHLNTKLQFNFLKEIIDNWIPDNCQFWTASHSLGFIQYAKESDEAIIFDFDDYDFDNAKTLVPVAKENPDVYEIAVNKEILPQLFKNYRIYFVENKDRLIYSELNIPHTLFVQENGKTGVYHKAKNGTFYGIIDRDFLSDNDIMEIEEQYKTLKLLRWYSIENYLFHPDNLDEYYSDTGNSFNKEAYIQSIKEEKNKAINELIRKLAITRTSYSFFKEPEFQNTKNQKRFSSSTENFEQVEEIEKYLRSNLFEDYYKVFPMKDYATQLNQRQHLSKIELAKTAWFKSQVEKLIQ